MIPLKYFSNFWRIPEMSLINCGSNLIFTWSDKCVLSDDAKATTCAITDAKCYPPVVTLQQLKSGFKRTVNWKKYQSKEPIQVQIT